MEPWEDNEERIERYLEGKMSLEEEETFMQELNANEELRKQYEDELLISALLDDEKLETDEIKAINTNRNTNDVDNRQEKKIPNVSFSRKYSLAIAAIAILIIATAVLLAVKTQNPVQQTTSINHTNKEQPSVIAGDSLKTQPSSNVPATLYASALYHKFYTPYVAKDNPVEISAYYNDYKLKNYKNVLAASAGDYQVMGAEANQQSLNNYMHLYKGLSYLEINQAQKAIPQFDSLLTTTTSPSLRYDAEWYKGLSYVKLNKIDSAVIVLSMTMHKSSPYNDKAKELLTELNRTK